MVVTCIVAGCRNRGGRGNVSFYHIPAVINHQGEQTAALTRKRRLEWMARINRKQDWCQEYARVCSDHFHSGIVAIQKRTKGLHK